MKTRTFTVNGQEKEAKWVDRTDTMDGYWEVDGVPFDGHRVLWSFSYEPKTYLKESELSGDEWRKGGALRIFRNGVCVYSQFVREPERATRYIAWFLPKLQEFPWEYVTVGRKLYDHDVPVVITSICDDGEVIVKTEDGSIIPWAFKIEAVKNGEETEADDEWKDTDRVHVLSEHLSWHRK